MLVCFLNSCANSAGKSYLSQSCLVAFVGQCDHAVPLTVNGNFDKLVRHPNHKQCLDKKKNLVAQASIFHVAGLPIPDIIAVTLLHLRRIASNSDEISACCIFAFTNSVSISAVLSSSARFSF